MFQFSKLIFWWQQVQVKFQLKLIQSTHTQRPSAGSSYPYVDVLIGDLTNHRVTQLQLEQVTHNQHHENSVKVWMSGLWAWMLFVGSGAVSGYRHAYWEYALCPREEADAATQWNHHAVTKPYTDTHSLYTNKYYAFCMFIFYNQVVFYD